MRVQVSSPGWAPSSHNISVLPSGAVHGIDSAVSVTRKNGNPVGVHTTTSGSSPRPSSLRLTSTSPRKRKRRNRSGRSVPVTRSAKRLTGRVDTTTSVSMSPAMRPDHPAILDVHAFSRAVQLHRSAQHVGDVGADGADPGRRHDVVHRGQRRRFLAVPDHHGAAGEALRGAQPHGAGQAGGDLVEHAGRQLARRQAGPGGEQRRGHLVGEGRAVVTAEPLSCGAHVALRATDPFPDGAGHEAGYAEQTEGVEGEATAPTMALLAS